MSQQTDFKTYLNIWGKPGEGKLKFYSKLNMVVHHYIV